MFMDDHKKGVTMMVGRRSAKGERISDPTPMKPEVVKTEDGIPDGRHQAMQEFMAAHREGSPEKMMKAMANFVDIHNTMTEASQDKGDAIA